MLPRASAALAELFEVALELRDAAFDAPPVDLQLCLTGTAGSDRCTSGAAGATTAAARTTDARQRLTPTTQTWESVGELRELDLLLAFDRRRALREDVEDQDRPVD